jgi:hypothetical protein
MSEAERGAKMKGEKLALRSVETAAVGASALASYVLLVRPRHLRWGATDEEIDERVPGDEIVIRPKHVATHAITIKTPACDVWPWLVQVGQTRGGFYSYTWLENLVGCQMHNADRIVPEWQTLRVGDVVWLHPQAPPLPVSIVEPYRAIVLGSAGSDRPTNGAPGVASAGTWGFYLKEVGKATTRLILRVRWDRQPGLLNWLANYGLFEPAHFVMERKMMLGIKQRAEGAIALRARTREAAADGQEMAAAHMAH